jgi:hypothetical protein
MSNTITRDFSAKARKALSAKGIEIIGVTSFRQEYKNGSWGYERAYQVNDNDCGKVWTRKEVEQAAQ